MREVIRSFPPVLPEISKILILGTMPSVKSLEMGEYYAHPQNKFWMIMGEIFSFSPCMPYDKRILALEQNGVALWDVLEKCERRGSGDDKIKKEKPNRIGDLLARHCSIRAIFFNGHPTERYFYKHFHAEKRFHLQYLPSTSPRYALKTLEQKTALWEKAIRTFM